MIVIGHRGCAALEPENTLRAFRRAIALGCDYVETDVRLTRDGHLVLMHDETVNRTTNGQGKVADLTFEQIRSLDAGKGERVPTLVELLEAIAGKVQLLCELKDDPGVEVAVRTVQAAGLQKQAVFTCFDLSRIRRVRASNAELRTGAIFSNPPPDFAQQAKVAGAEGAGVNYRHQSAEIIAAARREGLIIRAWNPDTEPEIQAMIRLGVDGITSNRPDLVLKLLGRL